ncbi:putative solute carrier family 13 [Helianthus annuus]|nr:putative solute carrier family 13 [Helianthus annuus]KAJ0454073.1 putative solute carrier family 13 [Helianthus annuus]KAJ0843304.1 putative solute carrier family 13 [Helianthus annuus]
MVFWTCSSFIEFLPAGWYIELFILQSMYFFIHYLIAGQTTHIVSLYQAFLKMHLTAKVPGTLSSLLLACNAALFGALTHYSSGQSAIYYGGILSSYMLLNDG